MRNENIELKEFLSFEDWIRKNFDNQNLQDMVRHGCSGGFGGLTYYYETKELYHHFNDEMWKMLSKDSENRGLKNVFEFIGTFNEADDVRSSEQFENLIVWYCAERVAEKLLEKNESEDIENE